MEPIAFVTLFLGLVAGSHPLEVAVAGEVGTVEVILDGRSIATLDGPPWTMNCDLGPDLEPHELVAVARDREGKELGTARQWVNLPRGLAEARLLVRQEGDRRVAQLTWQDVYGDDPVAAAAQLDGRPLEVELSLSLPDKGIGRIELPPLDLDTIHLLQAELEFPEHRQGSTEVMFGGAYGSSVRTELTAVALRVERGKLPPVPQLQGWLLKGQEPLPVMATEQGACEIVMVIEEGARPLLERITPAARSVGMGTFSGHRRYPQLKPRQRLRFLRPVAEQSERDDHVYTVFAPTRKYLREDGNLLHLIAWQRIIDATQEPQRIADAVAVAGLVAASRNHARVVVLVISADFEDRSRFTPALVRAYLQKLGVPLVVWSPIRGRDDDEQWGEVVKVASARQLRRALSKLDDLLDRQEIIWLDGTHLPQQITLSEAAKNVHMVR